MAAAGNQTSPDIASNGRDFLAIWADGRSGSGEIRASRLNADGEPLDPQGTSLGAFGPLIASNGDGYVVAGPAGLRRLDNDGMVITSLSLPLPHPQAQPIQLLANGSTYLLVTQESGTHDDGRLTSSTLWATVLNANLDKVLDLSKENVEILGGAVHGHDYYLVGAVGSTGGDAAIDVTMIGESGDVRTIRLPGTVSHCGMIDVGFSDTEILIGWSSIYCSNGYAVFDYAGTLKREVALPFHGYFSPRWDGHQFAFFFFDPERQINNMARLSSDGTPGAAIAVRPTGFKIASNGTRSIAVWSDSRFSSGTDIASRVLTSFDELAATPDTATLVSYSPPAAERPQIASAGSHLLAVWFDRTTATLRGSLDATPLAIAAPYNGATAAIATGTSTFVVTWFDIERETLFARQIAFDGKVGPLLTVASHLTPSQLVGPPAIAFDGSKYLVMWNQDGILGIHVKEDGVLIDPIIVAADSQGGSAKFPRLLSTPSGLSLAYSTYVPCSLPITCAGSFELRTIPLTSSSATAARPFSDVGSDGSFGAAVTGNRVTFVWPPVMAAQTTLNGAPIAPPRPMTALATLGCGSPWTSGFALLSAGAEIVLAWTEGNACYTFSSTSYTVRAIRVTQNLDPIDEAPVDISGHNATPDAPSLTTTPGGIAIAYSAYDAESGGAPRVFVRTLARPEAIPGRRRSAHP
ncbi:MAG: hypothetical protein ACXVIJ_00210 [Thermoanaerobaculia bacterium]